MAEVLDDGEFWLPSRFLVDEILSETKEVKACFPCEFPYDNEFTRSSLLGKTVGSTENENDEEDYMSKLTQQMVQSAIKEERVSLTFRCETTKERALGTSNLQSNPCSKAFSSCLPLTNKNDDIRWDLIYEAAGEVMKRKINQGCMLQDRGLLGSPCNPNQSPNLQKVQAQQFQPFLGHQKMQNRVRARGFVNERSSRNLGQSSFAWTSLRPQQPGSGLRALFLGDPHKKESNGTGFFLPRRAGATNEPRGKSACSTVLVPARVAHALNLKLDEMNRTPFRAGFPAVREVMETGQKNSPSLKRNQPFQQSFWSCNPDIRLPQEWTY